MIRLNTGAAIRISLLIILLLLQMNINLVVSSVNVRTHATYKIKQIVQSNNFNLYQLI